METRLLAHDDVRENTPMPECIAAVEDAFAAYARGNAQMPPKSYIDLDRYNGDFRSMPAYLEAEDWDAAGIKWVNVHPDNRAQFDLPTVMGTMIYSNPENALPLAILDGTTLTRQRTGAAAAVATEHLAPRDASSLGIVGAGVQSYTQLEAIAEVRDLDHVVVSDVREEAVEAFIEYFAGTFDVQAGSIADAGHCDILSTVTPVEDPIVDVADVGEDTHINAIGADAEGKHELSDDLLKTAKLVIDDYEQCTHSGEINVPWQAGILGEEDIHAELGDVIIGAASGRDAADGITVFDSTGLAIQDVAAAHVVYEHAVDHDIGTSIDLIGTE
ncbi:MAG: ornithine cyclodeaminase family protein [Halobacteriaceae archaeon]